ncbi:hypothetical protein LB519_15130 [Mesorhizobium sp. AD1-1]|nr:hypothetical protein [Mesorhizobium sp. AD1-1]
MRVKAGGSAVELANVKMATNPFNEIAVKEAPAKEAGWLDQGRCVSVGKFRRDAAVIAEVISANVNRL